MDLLSGWFAITTPVVRQVCHVKKVGYWFCFPVKHLVAVWRNGEVTTREYDASITLLISVISVQLKQILQLHTLPVSAYHALSLKEMGAVPGGAFRAF